MRSSDTKSKIILTSLQLFNRQGYDNTSINDIITKVGVSKGAFYHYFETKEDILEAAAQTFAHGLTSTIEPIVSDPHLSALDKFNQIIATGQAYKIKHLRTGIEIAKIMFSQQNTKFHSAIDLYLAQYLKPLFVQVFDQGNHEGVFHITDTTECADFYLNLVHSLGHTLTPLVISLPKKPRNIFILRRKVLFIQQTLERLLGAPPNSIHLLNLKLPHIKIALSIPEVRNLLMEL